MLAGREHFIAAALSTALATACTDSVFECERSSISNLPFANETVVMQIVKVECGATTRSAFWIYARHAETQAEGERIAVFEGDRPPVVIWEQDRIVLEAQGQGRFFNAELEWDGRPVEVRTRN
jgi:hypothetical protein